MLKRQFVLVLALAASLYAQQRIVSTAPALTETLFALGVGKRVVGVSDHCSYPAEVKTRTRVGAFLKPQVETILRLRPDLVIAEQLQDNRIAQLKSMGTRVQLAPTGDVRTNLRAIAMVADAAGVSASGKDLIARIEKELAAVAAQSAKKPVRSVAFLVGRTPNQLEGMIAVGQGSYLNELLRMAGGKNIFGDSPMAYPRVSLESIVRLRPDVILDMGDMSQPALVSEAHKKFVVQLWRSRPEVKSRVHAIANDIFVVPGPRMVDAVKEFYRLLHE